MSVYNIKTQEYKEKVSPKKAFSITGFYTDKIEEKLNRKTEIQFASVFNERIRGENKQIVLERDQLLKVKKISFTFYFKKH